MSEPTSADTAAQKDKEEVGIHLMKEDKGEKKSKDRKHKAGTHAFMVSGSKFVVDTKYAPLKPLGRGAYGVVCSALNKTTDKKVAIKKIPKAFEDVVDAKRILREIKLLRHFRHENIVSLVDLIPSPVGTEFEDLYMILGFMETDLHKVIYSKNALSDDHIQYFTYQMLKGLKYIHSANVLHRDLKPSNLLLNGNCDLQICDFGLARGIKHKDVDYELTEYVVTRWYRAPEVMCSCSDYDEKLDVWSVGCIFAELHGRKPLFPGDDYIKQMNLIFQVLGTPEGDDLLAISNDKALEYIKGLKKCPKVPFSTLYPKATPAALDLMEKLLKFNPANRISVDQALAHPYFKGLHNPKYEPVCTVPFNFDFEATCDTKKEIQDHMWHEIYCFRPEIRDVDPRGPAYKGEREAETKKE